MPADAPLLHEGRDGMREVIKRINWLLSHFGPIAAGNGTLFTASSLLFGDNSGAEVVSPGLTFVVPATTDANVTVSAHTVAKTASGTATVAIRVGGTVGVDGRVVGTQAVTTTGFSGVTISNTLANPSPGSDFYVKLTLKSPAGVLAEVKGLTLSVL